jgi:DNA-binding MarR family transcriptional regulator
MLAVLDEVVGRVEHELAAANLDGLPWRERVRTGLWTILCFLDREPVLARVCVAQALRGGPRVLVRREEILARLAKALDAGRKGENARACPPLTAEGLVGAVFSIVYARLTRADRKPLADLFGELMEMLVLPYLGPAVARREQGRSAPSVPVSATTAWHTEGIRIEQDPLRDVPMRLTYRTARVLETIAERPGVSNRVVGELAGVPDQGQISKLLARLERLGLTANTGDGHSKGESNAWSLTALGERVTAHLSAEGHRSAA